MASGTKSLQKPRVLGFYECIDFLCFMDSDILNIINKTYCLRVWVFRQHPTQHLFLYQYYCLVFKLCTCNTDYFFCQWYFFPVVVLRKGNIPKSSSLHTLSPSCGRRLQYVVCLGGEALQAKVSPKGWTLRKCNLPHLHTILCSVCFKWDLSFLQWSLEAILPMMDSLWTVSQEQAFFHKSPLVIVLYHSNKNK